MALLQKPRWSRPRLEVGELKYVRRRGRQRGPAPQEEVQGRGVGQGGRSLGVARKGRLVLGVTTCAMLHVQWRFLRFST